MLHVDFETRSACDLKKHGLYRYADDPTTDILCMAWAIDDDPIELWLPGDPIPEPLAYAVESNMMIAAHNAAFERLLWWRVLTPRHGFPHPRMDQFYCTAALCRARGFPGGLGDAARFMDAKAQKDYEGHRLMLKLCKPRKFDALGSPVWWDDPADHARLHAYCRQDVETERALTKVLVPLTEAELSDYFLSERINDRGIRVDLDLARAVVAATADMKNLAEDTLRETTFGYVKTHNQVARILEWVAREWQPLEDLSKETVAEALADPSIPDNVATVLEVRQGNARAAVSKFQAMLDRETGGYLRGLYLFHGAGQTGRWASHGVQLHNLVRETQANAIPLLMRYGIDGLKVLGDPIHTMARMVRPALLPSYGQELLIGDYAQIEARITAWLADEEPLLKAFADGRDVYCEFGTTAFGRTITKEDELERFLSKGCVLGLGFGGTDAALSRTTVKGGYAVPPKELVRLVKVYREKYPAIVRYWGVLTAAVFSAMRNPNTMIPAGKVRYLFDGQDLWCQLPSGRLVCYPYARIVEEDGRDSLSLEYRRGNRRPKKDEKNWPTVRIWHGLLIENLAQAIANDLLRHALHELEAHPFICVRGHTHDEIIAEAEGAVDFKGVFQATMERLPPWAGGLPVAAEVKVAERYVK